MPRPTTLGTGRGLDGRGGLPGGDGQLCGRDPGFTARRSPALPATVAIGTVTGIALGVLAYLLGPLGFPLRFAGPWPARLYDAAMALGVLLALCAPVTAGRAAARRAGRSLPAGAGARQGAMAGLCSGTAAALGRRRPVDRHYRDPALRHRAPALGHRPHRPVDTRVARCRRSSTPASATWRATAPSRRGTSSCCSSARWPAAAFGAWGARARPGSRRPRVTKTRMKRLLIRGKPAT